MLQQKGLEDSFLKRILFNHYYVALILATLIAIYIYASHNMIEEENQRDDLRNIAVNTAANVYQHFFLYYSNITDSLAVNPAITGYLLDGKNDYPNILTALETVKYASDASIVYIINGSGTVIASSIYEGNKTLLGNNYRFRPYFLKAMRGQKTVYSAVGVTTGERGVYFSVPVFKGNTVKGVAVIKAPLQQVSRIMNASGARALLLNPDGVVFDATEARWIYKSVNKLSAETLKRIEAEKQYAGYKVTEINWEFTEDRVLIDGIKNHFEMARLGNPGWDIVMYEPVSVTARVKKAQWSILVINSLLMMLLTLGTYVVIINVRRRRTAERHIVENEKHLRNILNSTNEGFWQINMSGITVDINPAMCEMLGTSREDLLGEPIFKYLKSDVTSLMKESLEKMRFGHDRTVDGVLIKKDGSPIFCIVNMTPLLRDNGEKAGFFAMITDVTEMKSKENEIVQSERNYREIFNSANDAIMIHDTDTFAVVDINERMTEMLGYSREESLKMAVSKISAQNPSGLCELMSRAASGAPQTFDWKIRKKDNSAIWAEISLRKAVISGYERLLFVIREIEDRKRSEENLKYRMDFENLIAQISRDFINLPFEQIDHGIERALMDVAMFANCTGGAVFVVDDSKAILTHEWHESAGDNIKDRLRQLDIAQFPYYDEMLLKNRLVIKVGEISELPSRAVNEKKLLTEIGFKPFVFIPMIKEGKVYGFIGFYGEDMRPKQWDEELILLLKIVGEAIVNALERKKYEHTLRETLNKLRISNEELEAFAYVASHDLKEPLRMISSYVKLLEKRYKDRLDKNATDFIAFASSGAERMNRLIDDLLAYSRVDRLGGEFTKFSMKDALDEVLKFMDFAINDAGAKVTVENELPVINADYVQIVQLIQNLIGNAVKYRSDRKPEISISAARLTDGFCRVDIKDNGIGIDRDYFEKIFIIFQQLHSKDKYPGTGIGLALCKKIVERHGGRIWVDSVPGQGSVFSFTLREAV